MNIANQRTKFTYKEDDWKWLEDPYVGRASKRWYDKLFTSI